MAAPSSPKMQRLVPVLLFGVFFLAGCGMFYFMALRPWLLAREARGWRETPCHILSSGVKAHHGHDGATYGVEVSYAYEVAGRRFESNRYQLIKFSSGGREAKEAVVARYRRGSRALCYVNPRQPSEAVLDRNAAPAGGWGLFPLVFVGIGGAGLVGAMRGKFLVAEADGDDDAPGAEEPAEPWLRVPEWAAGRLVSEQKVALFLLPFALLWNAVLWPVAWNVLSHPAAGRRDFGQNCTVVFLGIGIVLLVKSVAMGLRWRRFGKSIFEMEAVPGAIGGILKGTICLSRPISPRKPVRLRLGCYSRVAQPDNRGNSMTERTLWKEETGIALVPVSREIPVSLRIPSGGKPTTAFPGDPGVFWRLEAEAALPGIGYKAAWEVPVYEVELFPDELSDPPPQEGETGR